MNGDVTFIVDLSSSVGQTWFTSVKTAVKDVIRGMNVFDASRIAMIGYSKEAKLAFQLGDHNRRTEVLNAVENVCGSLP